MSRIPQPISDALEVCGAPWRIEKGTKHNKLIIADRMIATLPRGWKDNRRGTRNIVAQIRKASHRATA